MDLGLEILLLKKEILELKYGANRDKLSLRYNQNHDPDTGRFTSGPGGSGSAETTYGGIINSSGDSIVNANKNTDKPPIRISDKQFGKKAGKHAHELGLDVTNESGRIKLRNIIKEIYDLPDEVRIGEWRGQKSEVFFYIKGNDVVITKPNGEYISILKGGRANARIAKSRVRKV